MQPDVVRPPSAAPAWSMIALERARAARPRPGWPRFERVVSVAWGPLLIASACVVMTLTAALPWPIALGIAVMGAVVTTKVQRSAVGRRWRARNDEISRQHEAAVLKSALVSRLPAEQRHELARLEVLVEHVRARPGMFDAQPGAGASVVDRLDALIVTYVDLALELERSVAAFAVTAEDLPGIDERVDLQGSRPAYERIARLRAQARAQCHRRIARLRADRGGVGQLIRLVHEQTLAAGIAGDEVARVLGEVLDDAELARAAREELDGVLPRHREPGLPPAAGQPPRAGRIPVALPFAS